MLATQDKNLENTIEENVLTFYEKIKIKNNLESLFSHYSGSYVFIEVNPWKEEYIIRGKFHVKFGIFAKFEITFDGIEKLRKYSEFIESLAFLKNAFDELITPILDDKNNLTFLFGNEYVTEENVMSILESVRENKEAELKAVNSEIASLYETIEEVDNKIKDRKTQIKNMESYSCPTESHKECQGVYLDKESVSATDRDNFAIGKTFPELAGKVVYFSNYFINAFKDVNFGEYAEIGFMQDEGYPTVSRIILKGENATIIGPAMIPDYYEAYPIEGIMQFVRADLNQKLVVNRNKLIAAIERTQIFIANSDKDVIEFTFNPMGILINSKQSTAKETVTAKGCTSTISGRPVQANTILNFLRSLKAENITFEVDEKEERLFGIKSDDLTIIVSMYQE